LQSYPKAASMEAGAIMWMGVLKQYSWEE